MNSSSPVFLALARLYAESKAGRTGSGQRDFLVDLKKLLAACRSEDGDDRETAIRQLREQNGKLVQLEGPRRDADIIHQIRFPVANEAELFAFLNELSPTDRRQRLAQQFAAAIKAEIPERWSVGWRNYCEGLQLAAIQGGAVAPFSRDDFEANAELLALAPKLLAWQVKGEESLLRFASCVLTQNSKRLGELAGEDELGNRRGKLGSILEAVTGGQIRSLDDIGILQAPRFALFQGPLRLEMGNEWLNLGLLRGPCRLSETDIVHATKIECPARRCLTVENETSFQELAKLHSGDLILCTSYPGSATLALLQKLPASMEFWHFGDSDPEGFDILRDLRIRSGRPFQSLFMNWRPAPTAQALDAGSRRLIERLLGSSEMQPEHEQLKQMLNAGNKGSFEQESLGRPTRKSWPFYSMADSHLKWRPDNLLPVPINKST
jgi:hypothetical protein